MATEAEALLEEIRRGSLVALEVYLLGGGSLNARIGEHGDTLLAKACADSSMLTTTWLVEKGADVDLPNKRGETPLMVACRSRRGDVATHLVEHGGADIMAKDDEGRTALDHAEVLEERPRERVPHHLLQQLGARLELGRGRGPSQRAADQPGPEGSKRGLARPHRA